MSLFFLKNFPQWARSAFENDFDKYIKILQSLNQEQTNELVDFFNDISSLGVNGFGYRVFFQNGETAIFSANKDWDELVKTDGFKKVNLDFIKRELLFCLRNDIKVLTRSRDNIDGKYLSALNKTSVNNAVIIYSYYPAKIETFYFICSGAKERNYILNKCEQLRFLIDRSKQTLNKIINSESIKKERSPCLSKEELKICFGKKLARGNLSRVLLKGKTFKLSAADIECLYFLKDGISSSQIAKNIGRSKYSIKDRINSLKNKLNVNTKDELSHLAKKELSFLIKNYVQENIRIVN